MAPSELRELARGCCWAVFALASLALACTQLAPGSDLLEQRPRALEAGETLPALRDPKWACLGAERAASAVALRPSVAFRLQLNDPATQASPPDARVRACNRFDVECANPVQGFTEPAADGLIHLVLPQGFSGFLEITSPALIPALYFFNPPLRTDWQDVFIVVSFATAQALALSGNVALDPELGLVAVRTLDCQGQLSAGVEFSNNIGGVPFAFVDGLPVLGFEVSNAEGIGGFVNVTPGTVVIQGREADSGHLSGTSSLLVRKGWFAYGDLNPNSP